MKRFPMKIEINQIAQWFRRCVLFTCVLACGCARQAEVVTPSLTFSVQNEDLQRELSPAQVRVGGRSIQNRMVLYDILGDGQDVTLIIATIHGNEDAGTPLVRRLAQHLRNNSNLLIGRQVIIIPVANPDGRAARVRYNAHGVDLNRNFKSDNRVNNEVHGMDALSEPESVILDGIIEAYQPDKIVTLHQPLSCVDYDGPAQGLAQAMAELCPLPVKKLGARPGSLGAYAGETLKIPTITLEMKASDSNMSEQALWDTYGESMVAAILY